MVLDASPAARPDGLGLGAEPRHPRARSDGCRERFGNRTEFITQVEAAGQPRAIAQWLAMNLGVDPGGGFRLGVDLAGMSLALPERPQPRTTGTW